MNQSKGQGIRGGEEGSKHLMESLAGRSTGVHSDILKHLKLHQFGTRFSELDLHVEGPQFSAGEHWFAVRTSDVFPRGDRKEAPKTLFEIQKRRLGEPEESAKFSVVVSPDDARYVEIRNDEKTDVLLCLSGVLSNLRKKISKVGERRALLQDQATEQTLPLVSPLSRAVTQILDRHLKSPKSPTLSGEEHRIIKDVLQNVFAASSDDLFFELHAHLKGSGDGGIELNLERSAKLLRSPQHLDDMLMLTVLTSMSELTYFRAAIPELGGADWARVAFKHKQAELGSESIGGNDELPGGKIIS